MTDPTGTPAAAPPMPPSAARLVLGDVLYGNDPAAVEAAAEHQGVQADCAPLAEWLRAGGRIAPAEAEQLAWDLAAEIATSKGYEPPDRQVFGAAFREQHNHTTEEG